jgi:DNA-binding CsgD family transcriptional regulator
MWPEDPRAAALSALVLQLHRGCRTWPPANFKDRALELLADLLPFDAALWGTESPATLRPVALQGCRVSPELMGAILTQGTEADPLLIAARAAPGAGVVYGHDGVQPSGAAAGPGACWSAAGFCQGLAVAQIEPLSKQRTFLCLWRKPEAPAFGDQDQLMLQFLMPHLMETARESQLSRGLAGADVTPAARSHAVCDLAGLLLHVDDRCQALLRLEWPQWPGGNLPAPLLEAAQRASVQTAFVGKRIAVRFALQGSTLLLAVRLRAAHDRLSARQRGIAELYASGCTGNQIAEQLGLSASTVNNHLGEIFRRLQVNSKLQLARTLQGSDTA